MGVLDDSTEPVPVVGFPPLSVYDAESAILKNNCKKTITENSAYSPGASVSTTDQLKYYVPLSYVVGTVKLVGVERF